MGVFVSNLTPFRNYKLQKAVFAVQIRIRENHMEQVLMYI